MTYYKYLVIKLLWYWYKNKYTNGTEYRAYTKDSVICGSIGIWQVALQNTGNRVACLIYSVGIAIQTEKVESRLLPHTIHNILGRFQA